RPVLSVVGAETQPLWVEVAAFLRSSLPHVEECTIDGVGHLLHIQRPEPVARRTAEFLGRNSLHLDDDRAAPAGAARELNL
ncbi:MAG: alpha/beta fold hydrolase, partial [Candidatus Limnocylindria bacterium]